MKIALIAAIDRANAIGRDNAMPWHLPDDLKRFKALTLNQPILMGRKTAQSLGRALPKRRNLVLTRSGQAPFAQMQAVASVDEALRIAADDGDTLWVIGGGEIYTLTLAQATHLYLTRVDTQVADADAFFPQFDASQWQQTARDVRKADAKHAVDFVFEDYQRIGAS